AAEFGGVGSESAKSFHVKHPQFVFVGGLTVLPACDIIAVLRKGGNVFMAKDQPRLGRGLSSLISSTAVAPADSHKTPSLSLAPSPSSSSFIEVDVNLIDPNPMQP